MPRESLGSLTTSFDNFLCYLKIKHLRYSYKKKQKMEHSTTCMIQNPFLYIWSIALQTEMITQMVHKNKEGTIVIPH